MERSKRWRFFCRLSRLRFFSSLRRDMRLPPAIRRRSSNSHHCKSQMAKEKRLPGHGRPCDTSCVVFTFSDIAKITALTQRLPRLAALGRQAQVSQAKGLGTKSEERRAFGIDRHLLMTAVRRKGQRQSMR